jgi:hypothetical protein
MFSPIYLDVALWIKLSGTATLPSSVIFVMDNILRLVRAYHVPSPKIATPSNDAMKNK